MDHRRAPHRICVRHDDHGRLALLTVGAAVTAQHLGPIAAALIACAPPPRDRNNSTRPPGHLNGPSIHTVCRMRPDNREPALLDHRGARWKIPGATAEIAPSSIVVHATDNGALYVRAALSEPDWDTWNAARLTDTMLWALAAPGGRHMVRTTAPKGWVRPADAGLAGAGLNKPGRRAGLLHDGASTWHCSCGISGAADNRFLARDAGRRHAEQALSLETS
ncbi:hypothetical protein ACFC1T_08880 [Kitasatospora sp. NPDC056076]|uniref:hypothetical protein n=1 Tax=Kitasatospora sp. NPDC056076 TaxID=3345703 RepID=UPI0035DDA62F